MKRILIDTNIYSNTFRKEPAAVSLLQHYDKILLSPVVIAELLAGFKKGTREKENKRQLKEFLSRERVYEIPITSETSEFYAHIMTYLKKQRTPVPTNDIWIAAQAMENGAPLATDDGHFKKIPGILLV
ncbi:MAG: type II toxin-antitoxin system VapC family toxin [Spirochaetales bacterium]|nr:type II toxin-antitoxin system VapC family toxin [Spirochaetales bacterium]